MDLGGFFVTTGLGSAAGLFRRAAMDDDLTRYGGDPTSGIRGLMLP